MKKLKTTPKEERGAYVLMERIKPPLYQNILIRNEVAKITDVISELGIYGTYIWYAKRFFELSFIF